MEKVSYGEKRGQGRIALGKKNKEKVRAWFLKNRNGTQKDCQKGTGLALVTIRTHLRAILSDQK